MIPVGVEAEKSIRSVITLIEMKDSNQSKTYLLVVITALIGGSVPVFMKIILTIIPPFSFTIIRFLLAVIVLIPLVSIKKLLNKDISKIIIVSLFATINIILFSLAIRITSASISQIIYTTVPIFSLILSKTLLHQQIRLKTVFGILLSLGGVLLIITLPILEKATTLQSNLIGNFMILIAAMSYALYGVLSKPMQKHYKPLEITIMFIFVTLFSHIIIAIPEIKMINHWYLNLNIVLIGSVLYVGLLGTAFYYLLTQFVIKKLSPVIASTILYLQPGATIFWAVLLLHETITPFFVFGTIITLFGVWLTNK